MKWLLLYSKDGKSDFRKVSKYFKKNNIDFVFVEDSNENLHISSEKSLIKKMTIINGMLRGVTHIMCISIPTIPLSGIYLYALGLVSQQKISVFYSGVKPFLPEEMVTAFFPTCENIQVLFENLDVYFPRFLRKEKAIRAEQELAEKNIVANSDIFATAIIESDFHIAELIYSVGVDINIADTEGTPMLNIAVRNENLDMVKWLVERNANINIVSEDRGYTPLMDAVWKNNQAIVEYLISMNADVNTVSKDGQPLSVIASGVGNINICKILTEMGSDIHIKDAMGMSAYDYAALFSNKKLLEVYDAGKK